MKKYKVSLAVKIPANFEVEVSASSEQDAFDKAQDMFDGYDEKHISEPFWQETELDIDNENIHQIGNGIHIEKI